MCTLLSILGCRAKRWFDETMTWYSDEVGITIIKQEYGYIIEDGTKTDLEISWAPSYKQMSIYQKTLEEGHSNESDWLRGQVCSKDKHIIFKIEYDTKFDYKYKEIVFEQRKTTDDDEAYFSSRIKEFEEHNLSSKIN